MQHAAPKTRAVRPRDAASLVLIDRSGEEPCILMGRRHSKMSFVPDAFVFPGGKLDATDEKAKPATAFDAEMKAQIAQTPALSRRAEALAMAAIRETMEETGLLIAAPGDVGEASGDAWSPFRDQGLAPHLAPLRFVARAITPTESPIRFHARFYAAPAGIATGELRGSGELEDLDWYPLSQALKLPVIDVTEFVLHEVQGGMPEQASGDRPVPLFAYRNGRPLLRK
ncbi:NUDIX hydrolase [Parvibaculum sp. MBR-TMA-1.3b-4.2]